MRFLKGFLKFLLVLFVLVNVMLAFHAYRLTHFYDDPSLSRVKPEDLSAGEKAKLILFGIRYPKSIVNDRPQNPFQTIPLTTHEGLSLEGWYVPAQKAKGTVLLFHGHGSSKGRIVSETDYFHQLGYHTLSVDFRAHGNSGGNNCTIGYYETEEVKLAYDFVKAKGEKNIILWGVSMGAATILKAVPEYHLQPSRIILECPFGTLLDAVKGRLRMMGLPLQPISGMLTFWGGLEQGFWAFGYRPIEYAKAIDCPVLLNWGALDPRVTKAEMEALYANLATPDKQWVIFENAGHESYCRKEGDKWQETIRHFLAAKEKKRRKVHPSLEAAYAGVR